MVFYFSSSVVDPPATIYMGRDKHENEELIKYAVDTDLWFHVDGLSSAHVYLRMAPGSDWSSIDNALLIDCAQLTKANSIEGCKKDNITVVYTPCSNLRKSKGMDTGQVGFKKDKLVKKIRIETKDKAIVNRLAKTKVEQTIEFFVQEGTDMKREKSNIERAATARLKQEAEQAKALVEKQRKEQSYDSFMKAEDMRTNTVQDGFDPDDDFM